MAKRGEHLRDTRARDGVDRVRLTWQELKKLRRDVMAAVKARGIPNVVDVGVGRKNPFRERNGAPSLIFVVSRCVDRTDLTKRDTLGNCRRFKVRVGTGKRARWVNLASDVVDEDAVKAAPVGMVAVGDESGTAGMIVRWTEKGKRRWGVLTAGHVATAGEDGAAPVLESLSGEDIASVAVRYKPLSKAVAYDVAVLSVAKKDVARLNNSIDPDLAIGLKPCETIYFDGTQDDGFCRTIRGDVAIDVQAAFATNVKMTDWPNVRSLLGFRAVAAPWKEPFVGGNSGSAVADRTGSPMGLLVAAQPEEYAVGFAQPFSEVLAYLRTKMGVDDLEVIGFC